MKKVWASVFNARAIAFLENKGIRFGFDMLGAAVPKMIHARAADIGFTIDPVTCDSSKIVIEGSWGLGEGVVIGVESLAKYLLDGMEYLGRRDREVENNECRKSFKKQDHSCS